MSRGDDAITEHESHGRRDADRAPWPSDLTCVHCGGTPALRVSSRRTRQGEPKRPVPRWRCGCGAEVGCHPGTTVPLGRPADAATRAARRTVHVAMDAVCGRPGPDWKGRRERAYALLSRELGLPDERTHVALFDMRTCRRAAGALSSLGKEGVARIRGFPPKDGATASPS